MHRLSLQYDPQRACHSMLFRSIWFHPFPFVSVFPLLTLRIKKFQQQPPSSPAKTIGAIRTERDSIERPKAQNTRCFPATKGPAIMKDSVSKRACIIIRDLRRQLPAVESLRYARLLWLIRHGGKGGGELGKN